MEREAEVAEKGKSDMWGRNQYLYEYCKIHYMEISQCNSFG